MRFRRDHDHLSKLSLDTQTDQEKERPRRKIEVWGTRHPQRGSMLKIKWKHESTQAAGTLEKRSSNRGFLRDVLQHLSWTVTLVLGPSERKK